MDLVSDRFVGVGISGLALEEKAAAFAFALHFLKLRKPIDHTEAFCYRNAAFLQSGLKKAEFARQIGIPKTHIERLFSLRHHSRLNLLESALAVLGKRLHVETRDAA